ncbi:unnamed protein product [Orchesella dallaii]|uniref:Uncharacterized protein n=1 Tax=Orchesella dallaii TaxID=48710 RepID=A0ABP1QSE8_9HEXA
MNILRFAWLGGVLGVLLAVALQVPSTIAEAKAEPEPGKVVFQSPSISYEYPVGNGNDKDAQESRRISIAIHPITAASENTNVEVKVQKTIVSSGEDSKSNEVADQDNESEMEKRKRDCRGLPWPFVNALNATNCLDLDEEEFSARLINRDDDEDEDEDDATIVLPKKKKKKPARGGNRRYQPREEDYDEDTPYDPFHSPLPQARSYHEWAMMLRDMAPPQDGYYKGPVSYQDFHNYYRNPYEEQTNTPTGGWGWSTTPPPTGWGWTTTQAPNQRQPHELKNSFGQPSQPGQQQQQQASFGQPSSQAQGKAVSFGQPAPPAPSQAPPSFGQPPPAPQQVQQAPQTNQTQAAQSARQGKALEFGTPSQQQVNPPQQVAQPPAQQLQQRVGQPANPSYGAPPQQQSYLAPGYYGLTTARPYSEQTTQSSGWGWGHESTTKGWGWGETTTTTTQAPPPQYQPAAVQQQPQQQQQQQPSFGQQNQPAPTVFPIFQNFNQTAPATPPPPQQKPTQQVLVLPITDPANMNQTQVMDLYNRLLSLYKVVINDTTQPQQQQAPPPVYQPQPPNPWQVPPPQQVWAGAMSGGRGFDGYYPEEILPGLQADDPYLYDPLDQPKLLPRPISPVGRKGRQFRRRNSRPRVSDSEDEPRVSFMNDGGAVLHKVTNNEEFLPRRRYFKRKIDESDIKKSKTKKNTPRRWGSSRDEDDLDYETDPYMNHKHPNVPSWLRERYNPYDYQPPVYGQPPPPESSGGWGQPTPPPPTTGWGWPETTTAKPGWGWGETTTTASPGWGWGETTTTTTTTEAPPQEGQQQSEATTTEEGPQPGQQWNPQPGSPQFQAYLQQVNELIRQLQQNGQLPAYAPQQQQPQYGPQQIQQQQQPTQAPPTPQQVQQPAAQAQQVDDAVIEDIGRKDPTGPTPAFRDQQQPPQSDRTSAARQLFSGEVMDNNQNGQQQQIVSTVTSTSVSESVAPTPAPGAENASQPSAAAVQTNPQQTQQPSGATNCCTATAVLTLRDGRANGKTFLGELGWSRGSSA